MAYVGRCVGRVAHGDARPAGGDSRASAPKWNRAKEEFTALHSRSRCRSSGSTAADRDGDRIDEPRVPGVLGHPLMRLPDRLKRPKLRVRSPLQKVWPRHRRWVKAHGCCVPGCKTERVEFAHLRSAANAGKGQKPHDIFG